MGKSTSSSNAQSTTKGCGMTYLEKTHKYEYSEKLKDAVEQLCRWRIPMQDALPMHRLPRTYKFKLTQLPEGTTDNHLETLNFLPRGDRLMKASLSYPWEYLTWEYY